MFTVAEVSTLGGDRPAPEDKAGSVCAKLVTKQQVGMTSFCIETPQAGPWDRPLLSLLSCNYFSGLTLAACIRVLLLHAPSLPPLLNSSFIPLFLPSFFLSCSFFFLKLVPV